MNALISVPAVALLPVECNALQPINLRLEESRRVVGAGDAKNPLAILDCWSSFTGSRFGSNRVDLQSSEITKKFAIAACISGNSSLQAGIDSLVHPYRVRSGRKGARP